MTVTPGPLYPVKELIAQAVVAALEKISDENGYQSPAVEVVRPRRTGESFCPKHLGVAVIQDDEQREPDSDCVGNPPAIAWRLPIACDCIVRLSEADERPMDQVLNVLEADVRRALAADCQFGGLAVDSALGASEYLQAAGGVEGVTVWIEIVYRVSWTDPYTNRA